MLARILEFFERIQEDSAARSRTLLAALTLLATCIVAICALLIAFTPPTSSSKIANPISADGPAVFAILSLVSLASAIAGGFFGFLFGMPRGFSRAAKSDEASENSNNDDSSQTSDDWANNNLIEVSDWITKIVIGLTLVNLNELRTMLGSWGYSIGRATGLPPTSGQVIGVTLLLSGFCYGFVGIYILTRTRLSALLARNYLKINSSLQQEMSTFQKSQAQVQANLHTKLLDLSNPSSATPVIRALYTPKPQSFREAIRQGEDLLNHVQGEEAALINGYLACAYGQKYGYEQERGADPATLTQLADKAYEAAKRMVEVNPTRKAWLRARFDKKDPGFIEGENDLVPLSLNDTEHDRFSALFQADVPPKQ
jgi:hypothetical protein